MIRPPPRSPLFPYPPLFRSTSNRRVRKADERAKTRHSFWLLIAPVTPPITGSTRPVRSEEHTSELQSQSNLVCRLLLEKKTYTPPTLLLPSQTKMTETATSS